MKLQDNEGMTHLIHKEGDEYWVQSECFRVNLKTKSTTGKTLADFGPYKTLDEAINSTKVFDPNIRTIDGSDPVSIFETQQKLITSNEKPKKKSKSK